MSGSYPLPYHAVDAPFRLPGLKIPPLLPTPQVEGDGMSVVRQIFNCGESPNQGAIQAQGNAYLDEKFPKLSKIVRATIVPVEKDEP
jgi:hypothetical protein